METNSWDIATFIIITLATAWTVWVWWSYLYRLHKQMEEKDYIYWDLHHSNQHFVGVFLIIMLSIFSYVNTFGTDIQNSFIEHLIYNITMSFFLLPHLINEHDIPNK